VIRPAAPDGEAAVATVPASRWSSPGSRRSSTAPGGRLAGERFIAQAPPAVVKRALARAAELEERVAQLRTSLAG
jgi:Valyl tRNA synthetase tRNA binding arm